MTVQLDPGNDANSYTDALSRPWRTTAGLWKGAAANANDPGNVADSYSDAVARLWSATAHLWRLDAQDPGNATDSYSDGLPRLWKSTAGLWHAAYNSEVTLYNNLLNGLTDTRTVASISLSANGLGGTAQSSTVTLTIPKTGHYDISVYARVVRGNMTVGTTNSEPNGSCTVAGTAGVSDTSDFYRAANTGNGIAAGGYGYHAHGTYSSGQTVTFKFTVNDLNVGSMTGEIAAHWVPITAYPS